MKTFVLEHEFIEADIKPSASLARYRALLDRDVRETLAAGELTEAACPACRTEAAPAFERSGLHYRVCAACATLFVSPRPTQAVLERFYREAPSVRYWREEVLAPSRDARRDKLFRPRAHWVADNIDQYLPGGRRVLVGGYHNDLLVEELAKDHPRLQLVVTNAMADIEYAGRQPASVTIAPAPLDRWPQSGPVDAFLAFDLLDRAADPDAVFAAAAASLAPAGLFLATTTLGSGFDVQVLWDRSESIYPPDRLNLLSVTAVLQLAARHGFEVIEFSTPGVLDVEVVRRAIGASPDLPWSRFVQALVGQGEPTLSALQDFLQQHRLSSFGRIALRAKRS